MLVLITLTGLALSYTEHLKKNLDPINIAGLFTDLCFCFNSSLHGNYQFSNYLQILMMIHFQMTVCDLL